MPAQKKGFSLVELMVVIAIVAILSVIAIPSFQQYVLESNRKEGQMALLQAQMAVERFYSQNMRYPKDRAEYLEASGNLANSSTQLYSISYRPPSFNGDSYELSVLPNSAWGTKQNQDLGCQWLAIDNTGKKQPAACW